MYVRVYGTCTGAWNLRQALEGVILPSDPLPQIYTWMFLCVCLYACLCTHVCRYACSVCMHACMYICVYVHTHTHTQTHTHIHVYALTAHFER